MVVQEVSSGKTMLFTLSHHLCLLTTSLVYIWASQLYISDNLRCASWQLHLYTVDIWMVTSGSESERF